MFGDICAPVACLHRCTSLVAKLVISADLRVSKMLCSPQASTWPASQSILHRLHSLPSLKLVWC